MTSGEDDEFSIRYQKRKGRGTVSFLFTDKPKWKVLLAVVWYFAPPIASVIKREDTQIESKVVYYPPLAPKNPGRLSSRAHGGLSRQGPAQVRRPYAESTFQQDALLLVDLRRNSQFYWLREPQGGGSWGLALTGRLREFPEFPLGLRGKRQDGGRGKQQPRHLDSWVCGDGGSQQTQRHQFPEKGSESQRHRERRLSTRVHRRHTTVGAERTAAGINRAPSPGPALRSVQNGDLGSTEGKQGRGLGWGSSPDPTCLCAPPPPAFGRGDMAWSQRGREEGLHGDWEMLLTSPVLVLPLSLGSCPAAFF